MKRLQTVFLILIFFFCSAHVMAYDFHGGFIPQGTPHIDGNLSAGEWDDTGNLTLYKFFGEDSKIEIYLMWDANYLYIGANVQDHELWVDDYNANSPWTSTWDDDAFKWEIDPDFSRDEYFQPDDRVFAVNANGSATRFDSGDGQGGTAGVQPFDDILTRSTITGVLNDYTFKTLSAQTQKDGGFTVEAAISWQNLFGSQTASAPGDGYSMGMNFTNIEDDAGGSLDPEYYENWKRVADEITRFMGEEGHPENWAEFILSSASDFTAPSAVTGMTVERTGPFSAEISFTASGDNGAAGTAARYDIRYSTSPVTGTAWEDATVYQANIRPQKSGKTEKLKVIGLTPGTTYYLGIKAVDERGNASGISSISFSTDDSGSDGKGYLTTAPSGRYFAWEDGTPFIVVGDNQGMSWPHIRTFYNGSMWNKDEGRYVNFQEWDTDGIEDGRAYLKLLSEYGVNTIRIMAEDMDSDHPVYLAENMSAGANNITYNLDTLNFLETLLDECAKVDINVIVVPFDTFFYAEYFNGWNKVAFSSAKGGPMYGPEDFFEARHRDYIKAVLKKLVDTVGGRKNLMAWDLVNEFDSDHKDFGWHRASFAKREETMNALAAYMKSIDPNHMVFASSVRWDPKFTTHLADKGTGAVPGADPALLFNNANFDFNSTHTYYHDVRDPNMNNNANPNSIYESAANDLDKTIASSARIKQGMQFYYANTLTPKPYLCTEYGPIEFYTRSYDAYFTQAEDNQMFHNTLWSFFASGEVGGGLRWPGEMTEAFSHELSAQMRDYQLAFKHFIEAGNIDFLNFSPVQIGQYMSISGTSSPIITTGITDGKQGILFLTNDERGQFNGNISNAQLTVPKLWPNGTFTFEFWDSYDASQTAPEGTVSVKADATGNAVISLPVFAKTQAIKFYCTECTEATSPENGFNVTDDLWIRGRINTVDGAIEAAWQQGGQDTTAGGHKVIWGHFYASPTDVNWGSKENPDVFVKIWFDASGRVDVNFFHVSVPDIEVLADYKGVKLQGTTTLARRYIRLYYNQAGLNGVEENYEDGMPAAGAVKPNGSPPINSTINGLNIGAIINTVDGQINGAWRQGGHASTAGGHEVLWGHFYASPNDVSWGSPENPDLFVKVWFDASGRVDVNFFHVSVPDIEVYSDLPGDGVYDNKDTTVLSNRYIRHEYQR